MPKSLLKNVPSTTAATDLKSLVEHRLIYGLNNCEMNVFETHEQAALVPLQFSELVVTSMLRGKKVMHLLDQPGFDYVPGETVIVPRNVTMHIDFPEASLHNPTQCLALAIDNAKIIDTIDYLNNKYNHTTPWKLDYSKYFFYNNEDLATTITKLLNICLSNKVDKDIYADLALQELIIRIVQSQNLQSTDDAVTSGNSTFNNIISFIKINLFNKLNITNLTKEACMSTPSLYRLFKREIGLSPIEYILLEKIKYAKKLLHNPTIHINEVCYHSGFEDCNYFIRCFKKLEGITPKQYQSCCIHKT